ncbi:hypothetical protein O6H91_Y493000 [Diphasiastrum complanatum]|nr:hypothetical protein O6H91_Y493000 [Diphasiastrum complanatum]
MGFGGFYGGLFPVVIINTIISRLANIACLLDAFLGVIWFKRRGHGDGETTEHAWAPADELDLQFGSGMDSLDSIIEEIRGSLTSSPFDPTAEKFFCRGCAVCLSEFEMGESIFQLPHCSHIFHKACLGRWLDRHQTTCPLCRSSLLTEELSKKLSDKEDELADPWWCGSYGWNRLY